MIPHANKPFPTDASAAAPGSRAKREANKLSNKVSERNGNG